MEDVPGEDRPGSILIDASVTARRRYSARALSAR